MGGTKKQTNKLEHTQTNSPSMHFTCENTNWYVIRTWRVYVIYRCPLPEKYDCMIPLYKVKQKSISNNYELRIAVFKKRP